MTEVLVGLNVIDESGYTKYREGMTPLLTDVGGYFKYDFKIAEVLKSETKEKINRVFIICFPNKDVMNSFFSDEKYLAVKKEHFKGSVESTTIIANYEAN